MIKFTVQRPGIRAEQIKSNVAQLGWDKDPLLREYGMEIDTNMVKVCLTPLPLPLPLFVFCSTNFTIVHRPCHAYPQDLLWPWVC